MSFTQHSRLAFILFAIIMLTVCGIAWLSEADINWLGLALVFSFYLVIFGIGVWSGGKSDEKDEASFLLAGRKLPLWIAMLTMAATWLGGGYINGTAEAAAGSGLLWVQAPWGYGMSLIIGGIFFARKMRRYEFKTMLDPLAQRFGVRVSGLFFLPAVFGEVFWIAAILTALGTTFSVIIGLDISTSIIASALIGIVYTAIGGLWSVAYTDIIQLALLVFGLLLVMPFIISASGGMAEMWNEYQQLFGASASILPQPSIMKNHFWNWMDYGLLLIFGGIPWQVYFQRVLAAKNEKTAMWLSVSAGIICILVAVPAAIVGMVGAVTDWSAMGLPGPESNASILPYVFRYLTPGFIAMIGLSAISAAVMSSIDSSMLSAGTLSVLNVYKPLFRPSLSSTALKTMLRRSIILVGLAATFLSLSIESVYALWFLCSDLVYCLLFPALCCALFDPKANKLGAAAGFIIAFILRFGGGDATLHLPILIPYPMIEEGIVLFPFRTTAMLSGLMTMIIVSRLSQKMYPPRQLELIED